MGKPVNYNDIVEIINSNIELIDKISDYIVKSDIRKIPPKVIKNFKKNSKTILEFVSDINKYAKNVDEKGLLKFKEVIKSVTDIVKNINDNIDVNPIKTLIKINSFNAILLELVGVFRSLRKLSKYADKINIRKLVNTMNGIEGITNIVNDMPTISPFVLAKLMMFTGLVGALSMVAMTLSSMIPVMSIGAVGAILVRKLSVNISLALSAIKDACKDFMKLMSLYSIIAILWSTGDIKEMADFMVNHIFPAINKIFSNILKAFPKLSIKKYIKFSKRVGRWNALMEMIVKSFAFLLVSLGAVLIITKMITASKGVKRLTFLKSYISELISFVNDLKIGLKIRYKIWLLKYVITSFKSVFTDILLLFGVLWLFNKISKLFINQLGKYQGVILKIVEFFDSTSENIKSKKSILDTTLKITLICISVGGIMLLIHNINQDLNGNKTIKVDVMANFISKLTELVDAVMKAKDINYKDILKVATAFASISAVIYTIFAITNKLNNFETNNINILSRFIDALSRIITSLLMTSGYSIRDILQGIANVTMITSALLPMAMAVICISYVMKQLGGDQLKSEDLSKLLRVITIVSQINDLMLRVARISKEEGGTKILSAYKMLGITLLALVPIALLTTVLAGPATVAAFSTIPVTLFALGLIPMIWSITKVIKLLNHVKTDKTFILKIKFLCKVIKHIAIIGMYVSALNMVRPSLFDTIATTMFILMLIPFVFAVKGFIIVLNMLKFDKNTTGKIFNILKVVLGISIIAIALAKMSLIVIGAIMGMIYTTVFLVALILFLLLVKFVFWIVSLIMKGGMSGILQILELIGLLTLIAVALLVIGLISLMVVPLIGSIGLFMVVVIGVVLALVLIGYLAAMAVKFILPAIAGLTVMLVLVGILLLIGLALWLIGNIKLDTEQILENVKTIFKTIDQIVYEIFFGSEDEDDPTKAEGGDKGFGDFIVDMLGGAVRSILRIVGLIIAVPTLLLAFICVAIILAIAGVLRLLQELDLKSDKILENVKTIFKTIDQIVYEIFFGSEDEDDPTKAEGGDKGFGDFIVDMLGGAVRSILRIVGLIIAVPTLLLAFICVAIILAIAGVLRLLQELDLKPDKISANVGTVIDTATAVSNTIFNNGKEQPKQEDKPWYEKLWDFAKDGISSVISAGKNIAGAIMAIPYLMLILTSTGLVLAIVNVLNGIAKFDLKKESITTTVDEVVKCANAVIDKVFSKNALSNVDGSSHFKMIRVLSSITKFKNLVELMGSINNSTVTNAIKNLKLMQSVNHNALYLLGYIQKQEFDHSKISKRLDLLERFNEVSKDFVDISDGDVKKSKELTDNYIKFIDKVNGSNLENLKTTETLFKNMAEFSESINGNFDKLAEALNEKIAPLLEELKSLIEKVPQHIDKSAADQQRTLVETANNNINQGTYQRANISEPEAREMTKKSEKLTQSQYNRLSSIEKIVKILEGNDTNGGVKISKQR